MRVLPTGPDQIVLEQDDVIMLGSLGTVNRRKRDTGGFPGTLQDSFQEIQKRAITVPTGTRMFFGGQLQNVEQRGIRWTVIRITVVIHEGSELLKTRRHGRRTPAASIRSP